MRKLKVLDLFSGSGMFSLGFQWDGRFETKAFCERDEYARSVLRRRFPNTPIYEDVRTLNGEEVGPVDLICGGFPCQDISIAGKQAGIGGKESGLWSEFRRLIRELKPGWVVVENVTAMLFGDLAVVLRDLAALGYDAEWHCIPLTYLGAPHNRDRVWIIAYPKRDKQPWTEPRLREIGRVGGIIESVPWDGNWEAALSEFRRMDDGNARSVHRTDLTRNSLSPHIAQLIGREIANAEERDHDTYREACSSD